MISAYEFDSKGIKIKINIEKLKGDYVPTYELSIAKISKTTEMMLEKVRDELIRKSKLGTVSLDEKNDVLESKFTEMSEVLIERYFPDADDDTKKFLVTYLVQKSLGLGNIEFLFDDDYIEEIVVNSSKEPVWIYHKKHGWLKTSIYVENENEIKHYATMIGRRVGRQISVLDPMLDAHMPSGDRANATLHPISINGNTLTFRKFQKDPLTITHFLIYKTMSFQAAALIWHSIQYELSAMISGGTASGKTTALNVLANFFPPNQRIISIEDTRELRLPKYLHWVPMMTRLPNAEGVGGVTMEQLLVNSLRMRPDRILVGEVRRREEIETLFEAIHTGHSCYATIHANDAEETINRLVNKPFEVPKTMLPALSLIINQFRNRRTGVRRTFQIAEINKDSTINIISQYDPRRDVLDNINQARTLFNTFSLYSGLSKAQIIKELKEKEEILKYMVKNKIMALDEVGRIIANYYTEKEKLMKIVKRR